MSRWLVINVPSLLILLGIIVVVAGGAVLIQLFVRRRFPGLRSDEHNDATRFAFGVVGFVFAFFVGFVVSAMWGQINNADGKTRIEGAAGVRWPGTSPSLIRPTATGFARACWTTNAQP